MAIDVRDLQGARASSAVRCVAKAEHEALGTPREDNTPAYLERAFKRGVNVGRAWATSKMAELDGHLLKAEAEVPWGLAWTGHVDLIDGTTQTVYEAYHAAGGAFREEKALQAAFYADELGPEWKAELAVIDTTDVSDDEGFAVQGYEINVDGLREKVRDIKTRVVAAVEAGAVNPADKVGDTPYHPECRTCPFLKPCWNNWTPPHPEEVAGLETDFEALRVTESDYHHASAALERVKERRDALRESIRPYVTPGVPVVSGGTIVKVTEVAGRTSVKLTDFTKAGNVIPPQLAPFVSEGKPSERWKIEAAP